MDIVKLKDLTVDGKGTYGVAAPAVEYQENLPTYLRITDILDDGTLNLSELKSVKVPDSERYMLRPNDIVFARTGGSTGRNYFYDGTDGAFVYAGFLIKFSLDPKKVNPKFIKYFCQSEQYKQWVRSFNTGSTRGNINAQTFGNMEIALPGRKQQDHLVSILESIGKKIKLNKKINDNLQQQAVTLFKSWFVDFSLFGGTVPENWEDTTLENITTLITRGIAPKYSNDSDQTVINQKCIRNHTIDLSLARSHTPKAINEKWLQFGDLLINSTGDGTLGRVAQVWFAPKALTVDSHVTIVRPAREELIFYIGLWGILHEKEIESLHTGSTGQTELPRDRVKMLKLLLPDNISLSRFNSIIAPMTSTIISNQEENQKLANLRDTLLPKLMSCEIGVANIQL